MGDGASDPYLDAVGSDSPQTLVDEVERHLRALLRDVLCGYLDPDLRSVADDLLLDQPEPVEIRASRGDACDRGGSSGGRRREPSRSLSASRSRRTRDRHLGDTLDRGVRARNRGGPARFRVGRPPGLLRPGLGRALSTKRKQVLVNSGEPVQIVHVPRQLGHGQGRLSPEALAQLVDVAGVAFRQPAVLLEVARHLAGQLRLEQRRELLLELGVCGGADRLRGRGSRSRLRRAGRPRAACGGRRPPPRSPRRAVR